MRIDTAQRLAFRATCVALFAAPALAAQQFQSATGVLPGPNRWTEGVTAADIDLDGDLDLLVANGDGFASPGTQRQNTLIINQQVEQGAGIFTDESVARLGVNLSHAKQAIVGDVNGDGWPDLLYANAFNSDVPFLYINRGAAQPGFFDMESQARGLTEVLSSAGAQFGDVDDDGDLDLVVADAGSSLLGGAGERPRLYLNDGAGFFTDASLQLNAPTKVAQQDVNLVDMDNDWDLDIFIANRAANSGGTHYLLINDGSGNFTNQSALLPNTSGSVYEAEMGDLDGDLDRDFFFLSLGGFREGHMRNDLAETGSLGFTSGTLQPGNVDDNEVALFDFDVDGDFDIFVGSLGARERVYTNNGGLAFQNTTGVVENIQDSTLDMTIGDMDGDGDYDIITGQGESGSFLNRIYWNSGPADTLAPLVTAMQAENDGGWPVKIRGRIRDQVMDDGITYVTMDALVARVRATVQTVEVTGTGFQPSAITVEPGTRVRFVDAGGGMTSISAAGDQTWERDLSLGGSVERTFVAPLVHNVTLSQSPGSLQITVQTGAMTFPAMDYGNALYRAMVPAQPAGDTASLAYALRATDFMGNVGWSDSAEVRDPDAPGSSYCDPSPNSSGAQARIVARGSDILAQQALSLEAWALPQSSFGFFLASQNQDALAVSQGTFCLGSPFSRFSNFVQNSGTAGSVALGVPFGSLPPSAVFTAGDTWNFTYWFRDTNPGVGANFTDGVEIVWQ